MRTLLILAASGAALLAGCTATGTTERKVDAYGRYPNDRYRY